MSLRPSRRNASGLQYPPFQAVLSSLTTLRPPPWNPFGLHQLLRLFLLHLRILCLLPSLLPLFHRLNTKQPKPTSSLHRQTPARRQPRRRVATSRIPLAVHHHTLSYPPILPLPQLSRRQRQKERDERNVKQKPHWLKLPQRSDQKWIKNTRRKRRVPMWLNR